MAANPGPALVQVPKVLEDFSLGFQKTLAERVEGNFVSSALSLHIVLSMASYGAAGTTAEEMRNVLRLSRDDQESYKGFRDFIGTLNNISNVTLKLANKIYGSKNIEIKDAFKKITSTYFSSQSETVDFTNVATVSKINKWCSDETNGKIPKMFDENDLDVSTMMILLNAVYFKGNWKHKFNKDFTRSEIFHVDKTTTVNVPTMEIEKEFYYRDLEEIDAECIALPYENEDVKMIIIVPKAIDGLKNVEKNLEKTSFDYEKDLRGHKLRVALTLPKFKIQSEFDMIPHLQQMGIVSAFSDKANFSGISDKGLKINSVKHKAIIEVDEQGAEAAAITSLTIMKMSMPIPAVLLNVNKPFLYKIMYKSNTIFSGRVVNPLDVN